MCVDDAQTLLTHAQALLVIAIIGLLMFDIEKGIEEKYEMERNQAASTEEADDHGRSSYIINPQTSIPKHLQLSSVCMWLRCFWHASTRMRP